MSMNDEPTFYIVYSPDTIRRQALDFGWDKAFMPDFMQKGYYMSALPLEPWNIKFKGTFFQCRNVLHSINTFVYN